MLILYKAIVHPDGSMNRCFQCALEGNGNIEFWESGPWSRDIAPFLVECGTDERFTLFCHRDYLGIYQGNPYGTLHPIRKRDG